MSTLSQRFKDMPRVMRWAVIAGAMMVLYFVVAEPVLDSMNRLSSAADTKSAMLAAHAKNAAALQLAAENVNRGIEHFGTVDAPVESQEKPLKFNTLVDDILKRHGGKEITSTSRTSPLGSGPLAAKVGSEFRVDRLLKDIQFVADPEAATAVIADLERSPLVSTISKLQIRQAEGKDKAAKLVRVVMTVEMWSLARKGKK